MYGRPTCTKVLFSEEFHFAHKPSDQYSDTC